MGDPTDLAEFSFDIVPVEKIRVDRFHTRGRRRYSTRQSVNPCAWNGDPVLGGGASAHSVDTCNQNNVLNRHLLIFSR
jgi:hypothetical protein